MSIKLMADQRSVLQNKSLHLYLEQIAEALADSGQDMKQVISVPIVPTKELVKELMFRPVMTAMYPHKTSTTQLNTVEMQKVYRQFDYIMAEKFGISQAWPSEESLAEEQR